MITKFILTATTDELKRELEINEAQVKEMMTWHTVNHRGIAMVAKISNEIKEELRFRENKR